MNLPAPMRSLVERLTPRQRQYAMLGAILLAEDYGGSPAESAIRKKPHQTQKSPK